MLVFKRLIRNSVVQRLVVKTLNILRGMQKPTLMLTHRFSVEIELFRGRNFLLTLTLVKILRIFIVMSNLIRC